MPKRKKGTDPTNAAFRARIIELIAKAGGRYSLSRAAGISISSINNYLRGGEPTRPALCALAKGGNVSVDYLAAGAASLGDRNQFAGARRVIAHRKTSWERGQTLAYFHLNVVKEKFRGASPEDLLLVEIGDPYMQPRLWQDELVIVDGTNAEPRNGIFALMIDGEVQVRHIAKQKHGFIVHDRRKRRGEQTYSLAEFQLEVAVIGKAIISGHYPEITEDNFD